MAVAMAEKLSGAGQIELERFPFLGYYQAGNLAIQSCMNEESLDYAYHRFQAEGLLPFLFPDRKVGAYEFIGIFLKPESNTLGAFIENPETLRWDLQGMLWTLGVRRIGAFQQADVGHGFFRGIDHPHRLMRFAQLGLEWCFGQLNVDVVSGITPEANRAATLFARKLGFHVSAPLPNALAWQGELAAGVYSSMTKEQWMAISPFR